MKFRYIPTWEVICNPDTQLMLAGNANWDEGDIEVRKGREALARLSKLHVELDRSECARERGYRTLLLKILHSEVCPQSVRFPLWLPVIYLDDLMTILATGAKTGQILKWALQNWVCVTRHIRIRAHLGWLWRSSGHSASLWRSSACSAVKMSLTARHLQEHAAWSLPLAFSQSVMYAYWFRHLSSSSLSAKMQGCISFDVHAINCWESRSLYPSACSRAFVRTFLVCCMISSCPNHYLNEYVRVAGK